MSEILEHNLKFLSREMTDENELLLKISLHGNELKSISERITELESVNGYNQSNSELVKARDKRKKGLLALKALFLFYLTCGVGASANIGISNLLFLSNITGVSGIWYLSGIVGALVGSVWNFLMSSLVTWKSK